MKKWIVLTLVLAIAGGTVWALPPGTLVPVPPEQQLCNQMDGLCGFDAEGMETCLEATTEAMADHPQRVDDMVACSVSPSCREASGCLVGVGIDAVSGDVGEFLKGVGRGLGIQ